MAEPEQDAAAIAWQIAIIPRLRAKFLDNADDALAKAVPGKWPFGLAVHPETRKLRQEVRLKVLEILDKKGEIPSSRHAQAVMQQFFREAIRNPELSFIVILGLSIGTFVVGVALFVIGLVAALFGDDNTRDTIIASVFGAGGVAGALGSVSTLARRGVSVANANHAQIRLVLSDFATELGHLRALHLRGSKEVQAVNHEIREAMTHAVDMIQTRVKVDPMRAQPRPDGQLGAPSGQEQEEREGHS